MLLYKACRPVAWKVQFKKIYQTLNKNSFSTNLSGVSAYVYLLSKMDNVLKNSARPFRSVRWGYELISFFLSKMNIPLDIFPKNLYKVHAGNNSYLFWY